MNGKFRLLISDAGSISKASPVGYNFGVRNEEASGGDQENAPRKIGLMGGTFDPIHYGHLFIAEAARLFCGLEKVIFFPNNQPPHREGKDAFADAETRFRFVELGIESNPHFEASRVEIDRPGPSYAIDTLDHFQAEYSGAELFFLVGADSINDVLTWHRGAELFEMCRFVAASRPGFDWEAARRNLSPRQLERTAFLSVPGLHIASRDLRERVRRQEPIRYLVPDAVCREIECCHLYR